MKCTVNTVFFTDPKLQCLRTMMLEHDFGNFHESHFLIVYTPNLCAGVAGSTILHSCHAFFFLFPGKKFSLHISTNTLAVLVIVNELSDARMLLFFPRE